MPRSPENTSTGHVPPKAPIETQIREEQLWISVKLQCQKPRRKREFILRSMTLLNGVREWKQLLLKREGKSSLDQPSPFAKKSTLRILCSKRQNEDKTKATDKGGINDQTRSLTAQASAQLHKDQWASKLTNLAQSLLQPLMLSLLSYRSKRFRLQLENITNSNTTEKAGLIAQSQNSSFKINS